MLENIFRPRGNGTNKKTEFLAGSTTFLSMAYLVFGQPAVPATAGMDFNSVMIATCLTSMIACFLGPFSRIIL